VLSEAHAKVRECLRSHREALEELAKLLLEKEVVDRPQLQAILKKRSADSGLGAEPTVDDGQRPATVDHKS